MSTLNIQYQLSRIITILTFYSTLVYCLMVSFDFGIVISFLGVGCVDWMILRLIFIKK